MSGLDELVSPIQREDIITAMDSILNKETEFERPNLTQLGIEEDTKYNLHDTGFDYSNDSSSFLNDFSLIPSEPEDNDWVFVPDGEPMDSGFIQTTFQKQRSKSSSLDKTLSYVFTKESCDYTNKTVDNKKLFPAGAGKCELSNPHGLAYEKETDRIFIADTDNNRIQVHSLTSALFAPTLVERTRSFSLLFIPEPKMNKPWGVCTSNGYVYVTQYKADCVDVYTNHRNFVSRFGSRGFGIGGFCNPTGICAIGSEIYVCDSNNNRIQVLRHHGKELKYVNNFGIWKLKSPRDIKVYKSEIFVLDSGKNCMHIFNLKFEYLRSLISNGERREVDNPQYFDIDEKGNLLISDWLNHSVKVFEPETGKKIAEIATAPTLSSPLGIAVSLGGDVFVVDTNKKGHLNVF